MIAWVLLSKATFGRHLYALGTSATVAEFSGVPTTRTRILTYTISGVTAALAGMLLTGYSGQAYLGMGDPYLFTSIAAVAIGGASILGGSGHYVGTIAGAFVLTILTGLLPALNLSSGALLVVYGVVILLTVAVGSETLAGLGSVLFRRRSDGNSSKRQQNGRRKQPWLKSSASWTLTPYSARAPSGTPPRRCCGGSTSGDS